MNSNPQNPHSKLPGSKLSDFRILQTLGKGSYGTVYRVESLVNGKEYVMKKIQLKYMKLKHQKESRREVEVLKKIRHQNIIKYYTSFMEEDSLHIIMEYAFGGDLHTLIKHKKEKKSSFKEQEI